MCSPIVAEEYFKGKIRTRPSSGSSTAYSMYRLCYGIVWISLIYAICSILQYIDTEISNTRLKTSWVGKNITEQLPRRSVMKGITGAAAAGAAGSTAGCTEVQYLFSEYDYVELEELLENGLNEYYDEDFGGEKIATDGYSEEIGTIETYPDDQTESRSLQEHRLYPEPDAEEGIRVFADQPPLPSGEDRHKITVRGEVGKFYLDEARDDPVYALMNRRASFNE